MREKPDCFQCRAVKAMAGREPPCDICLPTLYPCNAEAANIYMLVRDQVITAGMTGAIIALQHEPLWKLMDEYRVDNRIEIFEKVRAVFYHILDIERLENMNKSGDKR